MNRQPSGVLLIRTKGRLLRPVWGEAYHCEDDSVHVHVSTVRRKLNDADPPARAGSVIMTKPGVGYRIGEPAPMDEPSEDDQVRHPAAPAPLPGAWSDACGMQEQSWAGGDDQPPEQLILPCGSPAQ